jgi:hypothetical protein
MTVKIIKLQNNTEIIGTATLVGNERIEVDDPFTINYVFSPKSERPVIGLLRYLPFAEDHKISFSMSSVLNVVNARDSMSSYYQAVLANHVSEIDKSIDEELQYVSDLEKQSTTEEQSSSDILSALVRKINNNLH